MNCRVRNGWPAAGSRQSRCSSPATTTSCSVSGSDRSVVPGMHRSISNAVVSPTVSVSYSLAAPSPSHAAKAVRFVGRLEVRPTDLQNDIAPAGVARGSHPRGHAARLERFTDLQGPAALEPGHDRRQLGDPRLHALVRRAGGLVDEAAGDGDVMHVTRHHSTSRCRIQQ